MDPSGPGFSEAFGIAQLVIVQCMRQRHHDGRAADDAELGNCRGARSAHHKVRTGDALRHVHEEGREIDFEAHLPVGGGYGIHVLRPHLLGEPYPNALLRAHRREHLGHELAEELRALAAAEDEKVEAIEGRVRCSLLLQRDVAHRIASEGELCLRLGRQAQKRREGRGHRIGPFREHPVGAAHHGVLIVHAGGYLQPRRRHDGREGRVAPEADHRQRLHPLEDGACRTIAAIEPQRPARHQPGLRQRQRG